MIRQSYLYEAAGLDPYRNLAAEEHLLSTLPPCTAGLYLWQNDQTVVIGRNQAARRECDVAALAADGGHLARRLSGGGAVYHDTGNLNFTFLLRHDDYDAARQSGVLLSAVRALGVDAELSGRNDLTVGGKKISGNAFCRRGDRRYHHGTLLIGVDLERMQRYLLVSDDKLRSKGVPSVRSRVVNLRDIRKDITVPRVKEALVRAFVAEYGVPDGPPPLDESKIAALREKYASDEWLYGNEAAYDLAVEKRFPWGAARLEICLDGDLIRSARVYTDAMDEQALPLFAREIAGVPLARAAEYAPNEDMKNWLKEVFA